MAKKVDYEISSAVGTVDMPEMLAGAMEHLGCTPAKENHLTSLGFPEKLVDNWQDVAVEKMKELVGKYRGLKVFLETCVKCGTCTDKCHYYLGTGDPNNMPVGRQDLMRKIYRRYQTLAGKVAPSAVGAEDLTEDTLKEWLTYFYQCSECRRCSVFCPFGIDTAEITMAAREILNAIGLGQKYSLEIMGKVHSAGNNLGIPKPALEGTLEFLEEDMEEEFGIEIPFPLDKVGVDVMLVVPSADFFSSPHVDSLIGYAKVFHAAGISFTFSSHASEFANFGLFMGNFDNTQKIAQRILDAAKDLQVKRIVVGECGHAWRVGYSFWNTLIGPFDFLDQNYPIPQHICEFTWDLIEKGVVKLDKSKNDDHVVTFHDSCNVARASRMGEEPGGQFTIPRNIIKACCNNYVEMADGTTGEQTFCCGGGGGLLTDELMELRVKGGLPRIAALKEVMQEKKVNTMAMICAICKAQFTKIFPYYGLEMDAVAGVHQLVSNAIILEGARDPDAEDEDEEETEE